MLYLVFILAFFCASPIMFIFWVLPTLFIGIIAIVIYHFFIPKKEDTYIKNLPFEIVDDKWFYVASDGTWTECNGPGYPVPGHPEYKDWQPLVSEKRDNSDWWVYMAEDGSLVNCAGPDYPVPGHPDAIYKKERFSPWYVIY